MYHTFYTINPNNNNFIKTSSLITQTNTYPYSVQIRAKYIIKYCYIQCFNTVSWVTRRETSKSYTNYSTFKGPGLTRSNSNKQMARKIKIAKAVVAQQSLYEI